MIVKVQRSITTSEAVPQVLVYNEDRSLQYQGPLTMEVAEWFEEDEYKFYADAEIDELGRFALNYRVEEQDW